MAIYEQVWEAIALGVSQFAINDATFTYAVMVESI
jgi:hypothetical protein